MFIIIDSQWYDVQSQTIEIVNQLLNHGTIFLFCFKNYNNKVKDFLVHAKSMQNLHFFSNHGSPTQRDVRVAFHARAVRGSKFLVFSRKLAATVASAKIN